MPKPTFVSRRERTYWTVAVTLVVVTWATLYWARPLAEWFRERGWLTELMLLIFATAAAAVVTAVVRLRPGWREGVVLAVFGVAYALAIGPVMGQPEEALHFVQYGAVGGFFYAALGERGRHRGWGPLGPALAAFLLATAAGWIDEGIQHLLPNRYYDLRDVGFNAGAAALAIAAMASLGWARQRGGHAAAATGGPPAEPPADRR